MPCPWKLSQKFVEENDEAGISHFDFPLLDVPVPLYQLHHGWERRKIVGVSRVCKRKSSFLGLRDVIQRKQLGKDYTNTMATICAES